jgi:hypothetical protein
MWGSEHEPGTSRTYKNNDDILLYDEWYVSWDFEIVSWHERVGADAEVFQTGITSNTGPSFTADKMAAQIKHDNVTNGVKARWLYKENGTSNNSGYVNFNLNERYTFFIRSGDGLNMLASWFDTDDTEYNLITRAWTESNWSNVRFKFFQRDQVNANYHVEWGKVYIYCVSRSSDLSSDNELLKFPPRKLPWNYALGDYADLSFRISEMTLE